MVSRRALTLLYRARVTAAILSVGGAVNVTALTLNGVDADVILTQTGVLQEIPTLGEVTLRAD